MRASSVVGLLLLLFACSEASREEVFTRLRSPDKKHTLLVTVIAPAFPLSPHKVVVYLEPQDAAQAQRLSTTTLANDGVPFTTKNIGARWISADQALVCLRAADRPDRGVRVTVSPPRATVVQGC